MKSIYYFGILIMFYSCNSGQNHNAEKKNNISTQIKTQINSKDSIEILKISNTKMADIANFLETHKKFNDKIVFLVDMRRSSRNYRFFIVSTNNDSILDCGLVAQGINSKNDEKGETIFSNQPNSNCTSLGKYSIGNSYQGQFGKAYKLYGLEETNSNAFNRSIVLHQHSSVPDITQEYDIQTSNGCPMVSPKFFKVLEKIIDNSQKPILLDIYY